MNDKTNDIPEATLEEMLANLQEQRDGKLQDPEAQATLDALMKERNAPSSLIDSAANAHERVVSVSDSIKKG